MATIISSGRTWVSLGNGLFTPLISTTSLVGLFYSTSSQTSPQQATLTHFHSHLWLSDMTPREQLCEQREQLLGSKGHVKRRA